VVLDALGFAPHDPLADRHRRRALPRLHLDFGERLNCIIGGRGTGKSGVLNLIRFALGALIPESYATDAYAQNEIEGIAKSAKAQLDLVDPRSDEPRSSVVESRSRARRGSLCPRVCMSCLP
jgi:hypothetical protein